MAISGKETKGNKAIKVTGKLRSELEFTDAAEIIASGLHEFMDAFQKRNNEIGAAIYETYFALKPVESFNGGAQHQG